MRPGPLRSLTSAVLVALAALVGRLTVVEGSPVDLVWPAAGVAALWMLLSQGHGRARSDALLLGAVLAAVDLATGTGPLVAVSLAAVDVGQAVLFARLYTRWSPTPAGPLLRHTRDLAVLLLATGLATTAGALVGSAVVLLETGSGSLLGTAVWQACNGAAVLVVVSLGLRYRQLLHTRRGTDHGITVLPFRAPTGWRVLELAAAVVASVTGNLAVFLWMPSYPIAFPLFALTAWVALRFDTGLTTLRTAAVSVVAAVFTLHGDGPFAAVDDVLVRAGIVQGYIALGAALGLALALNRDERLVLEDRLRAAADYSEERHRQVQVLATATRAVLLADDPRTAVCQAVREATGADGVYLIEPEGPDRLVSTVVVGIEMPPLVFDADPTSSMTSRLFADGEAFFVPDAAHEPGVDVAVVDRLGIVSAAWQPAVLADDRVVALIGVVWRTPVPELCTTTLGVLSVLGGEAARAIERGNLLEQLARAADRDQLTGLANRRRWDELSGVEVSRAQRSGLPLTLLLLDLDHFKVFNDTFGHATGDVLLRDFAGAAAECLRDGDLIARWGGEEFAVALPSCTAEEARPVAERILAAVPHGQTATVGIAQWLPGESVGDTLARADGALYRGKRGGRARAVVAGQPEVVPA